MFSHTIVYEQESDIQFRMRAETVLSKIINENPTDSTIAVISHGGLIGQLFQSFFNVTVIFISFRLICFIMPSNERQVTKID